MFTRIITHSSFVALTRLFSHSSFVALVVLVASLGYGIVHAYRHPKYRIWRHKKKRRMYDGKTIPYKRKGFKHSSTITKTKKKCDIFDEQAEDMVDEFGREYVGRRTTHTFTRPRLDRHRVPIDAEMYTSRFKSSEVSVD